MDALQRMTVGDVSRFLGKVNRSGSCWMWTAAKDRNGYGLFKFGDTHRVTRGAHRVAYFVANDELPKGMLVCHRCDNPGCVNPAHLFLGSYLDNSRDCFSKGRARRARGDGHVCAKLTESEVQEIRDRFAAGEAGVALAEEYGVSKKAISHAAHRRTWKHVP